MTRLYMESVARALSSSAVAGQWNSNCDASTGIDLPRASASADRTSWWRATEARPIGSDCAGFTCVLYSLWDSTIKKTG